MAAGPEDARPPRLLKVDCAHEHRRDFLPVDGASPRRLAFPALLKIRAVQLESGPSARVTQQGVGLGAAVFDYLDGEDFRNGAVTFASAYGGDNNHGQVWRYTPSKGTLLLLYETHNRDVLDTPDNVAVSPRGGVLICEDGYPRNFLRGLTPAGQVFDFAENLLGGGDSEFAGPAYSPDGKWLIVAIQRPGITLAITGPWGTGLL